MLWHLRFLLTLQRLSLQELADSWKQKWPPSSVLLIPKPTSPKSIPQPPPLLCSHALGHCPPALITSGPGTRQEGHSRAHWNYSKGPILILQWSLWSISLLAPSAWPSLVLPCVAHHSMACPFSLGNCEFNKLSFQWQLSPDDGVDINNVTLTLVIF